MELGTALLGPLALLTLHFLSQGMQMLIGHFAARSNCDKLVYTSIVAFVTSSLTFVPLLSWLDRCSRFGMNLDVPSCQLMLCLLFVVIGGVYAAVTYARLQAQKTLPSYVFAPLSRLSLFIVVLVSVLFLGERRSLLELAAIAVMFVPLTVLGGGQGAGTHVYLVGIVWTVLASLGSSGLQLASKVSVDPSFGVAIPVVVFVFGANAGNFVVSSFMRLAYGGVIQQVGPTLRLGLAAGVLNVMSFATLVSFLEVGDASRIYPISSLSMVIPVAVLRFLGREKRPGVFQWISIALAMAAGLVLI